jgi:hypothetical protein
MAYNALNSRIDISGLWNKAAALADTVLGSATLSAVPTTGTNVHFKNATIKDIHHVVSNLKYNTSFAVGTNKYGYLAADDLGAVRAPYWWDGTTKASAAAYVNNTTAFNYALAGLARPSGDCLGFAATGTSNGRMLQGDYYYMYTWYDTVRQVESLPSGVIGVTKDYSVNYIVIGAKSEVQSSAPSVGSPRYNTNTKIRFYRSKRTNTSSVDFNPPNRFYFIGEMDYPSTAFATKTTSALYDHAGAAEGDRKLYHGTNNTFANIAAGQWVYLSGAAGAGVATGWYYVTGIDATNHKYLLLAASSGLTADDTSIQVEGPTAGFIDYMHDNELLDEYEGRGTPPPTAIDCIASFNNRMYYFVKNTVYWSSAGRPEEVALKYTLTYTVSSYYLNVTASVENTPLLSTGAYGEAKYEIAELNGETIVAAYVYKNRLYLWTNQGSFGYLENSYAVEGARFTMLRKGISVISDKTLAETPYGLFGADREGVWQLDTAGQIYRLSKNWIDIDTSTKTTYAKQSTLTDSFGVWSARLDEYIWCLVNTGETVVHRQIAYNPVRRVFSGIYAYPDLTGGCEIMTSGGVQNYLTGAKTFNPASVQALAQTLQFWMGQDSLESIKDSLEIEVIYSGITTAKTVTINVYQNNIASTTGASSLAGITHTSANLVGIVKPSGSGRMFLVEITIPADCTSPIVAINYIANYVEWNEKGLR